MNYRIREEHRYFAEIPYQTIGKEELLVDEFMRMKAAWPSMSWDIGVNEITFSSYSRPILEAATEEFLRAVQRHGWWED